MPRSSEAAGRDGCSRALALPAAIDLRRGAARSRPLLGDLKGSDLVAEEEAAFLGSHVRALLVALAEKDGYTESKPTRRSRASRCSTSSAAIPPRRTASSSATTSVSTATGHPRGAEGTELALDVRILAVCDVYDALLSTRVYRPAWTHERAVALLRERAGRQLDSRCVDALDQVLALERGHALGVAV
jgi:hypothetical protein